MSLNQLQNGERTVPGNGDALAPDGGETAVNEILALESLAKMIDHSLLHPTLTDEAIVKGCEVARKYGVATACVKPYAIQLAQEVLSGSGVGICAVVAFPHGNSTTSIKVQEAKEAVLNGAGEIDMVVNIGRVLGEAWDYVSDEIHAVNEIVAGEEATLKVIFENDYLEDTHILRLCEICAHCAVAYVKTSTGYGFVRRANGMYAYAGATDHHLRLMREHCPPTIGVKAAGGIRTLDDLLRVRRLGVTRIGATATADILEEARKRGYH
jgi:deoxyribose-phosphate aldolase